MSFPSLPKLNKFADPSALKDIVDIVLDSSSDASVDETSTKLVEFATAQGISNLNALKSLIKDIEPLPRLAVKKNWSAAQLMEELKRNGLEDEQANVFVEVFDSRSSALRLAAMESSLSVNQLVDLQWKFGVTAASSDVELVGNTFLQMKLTMKNSGEDKLKTVSMELSLPQFYKFLHEMEKAKTNMEMIS